MRSGKRPSRLVRVVLDTNVLVSAFFWAGNEREVHRRCREGLLRSITTPEILKELDHVLINKFRLPESPRRMYLRMITMTSEVVFLKGGICVIKEDPTDDKVLETAIVGRAEIIVTGDRHLLSLGCYEGIRIIQAREL